jgi:hypothetical protein
MTWPAPSSSTVPAMSRPKQFEEHRFVGDKRTQRVHDLDHVAEACQLDELLAAETYVCFGPDSLTEARNRCYKPCRHCNRSDADQAA